MGCYSTHSRGFILSTLVCSPLSFPQHTAVLLLSFRWVRWRCRVDSCSRPGTYSKGRPWLGLANVKADWFSRGPLPRAVPLPRLMHLVLSPGIQPAPVEQLYWTFPHSPFAYLAHRTCTCPCGLQDRGSVPLSDPLLAGHPASRRSASPAPSQGLELRYLILSNLHGCESVSRLLRLPTARNRNRLQKSPHP